MPDNSWEKKVIEELASDLLSAICGVTVEEAKRRRHDWRSAKNIVRADSKNIEQQFGSNNALTLQVRNFFREKVVPSYRYYSVHDLTAEEIESLWRDFCNYLLAQELDAPENDSSVLKKKLTFCVNAHNKKIRESSLSTSEELSQSVTQRGFKNVEAILRQISDTLSLDTNLQDSDDKLDYLTQQIESILRSIRIDLQKSRHSMYRMMVYLIITALIAAVSVWLTINHVDIQTATIELIFLSYILLMTFIPLINTLKMAREKERKLNQICSDLLKLHYGLYAEFLKKKMDNYSPVQSVTDRSEPNDQD